MRTNLRPSFVARALVSAGFLALLITTAGAQGPPSPPPTPPPTPPGAVPSPLPDASPRCNATIGGLVYRLVDNDERAGLRGIQVQLLDGGGTRIAQRRTDREGIFAFRNVCAGVYTVCVGTPCPADGAVPSLFDPPTEMVTVGPRLQRVLFRRLAPPPLPGVNP